MNFHGQLVPLRERPDLLERAAVWFHEKWGIPEQAYRDSMTDSLGASGPVPRWYVVMGGDASVGGLGVIEDDVHLRRDLTPNVCAVYVEPACRNLGIAGRMLNRVCDDFHAMGVDTLYLATEHTSFYERYGWEFYCLSREEDNDHMTRMYRHIYEE